MAGTSQFTWGRLLFELLLLLSLFEGRGSPLLASNEQSTARHDEGHGNCTASSPKNLNFIIHSSQQPLCEFHYYSRMCSTAGP